ncbi:MAG: hypothetical protein JXJ04_03655 [Spirochaetales bacterium]|nr:hypothetical protein [Spirochaetales bacterium]
MKRAVGSFSRETPKLTPSHASTTAPSLTPFLGGCRNRLKKRVHNPVENHSSQPSFPSRSR